MIRRVRLLLRSESGLAVPVVMGTMVVMSLLASGLLATALRSASGAQGDTNAKRALAAAEAGLQTAKLRLKQLNPAGTMCMATPTVPNPTGAVSPSPATVDGTCPASTPESIGAGATFTYWVTPRGATCALTPATAIAVNDRCITSLGVVNGVRRRIQERVESGPNYPFAKAGVVGTDKVTLTNDVQIAKTDVGSNGPITMTGTPRLVEITAGGGVPGEARPYVPTGGSVIRTGSTSIAGGVVNATSPYGLNQPDFAASLTPAQGGTGTNNNAALASVLSAAGIPASAWNASTRVLNLPANKSFILPAGTYNFCNFTMGSASRIDMPNSTAQAKIFLDSPLRNPAGAGCGTGTGKAVMTNAKMNNGVSDRNIWFWVYGTVQPPGALPADSASDIQMLSGSHIDAVWYAPYSRFYANNAITVHGAVAAREVVMTNNVRAGFDVAVAQELGPGAGPITRRGWFECQAVAPVAADPESGC